MGSDQSALSREEVCGWSCEKVSKLCGGIGKAYKEKYAQAIIDNGIKGSMLQNVLKMC